MENQKLWLLQRIYCNDVTPIVIKEGLYKIGRSPESNILCKSEWVSRFHCDVTVRDGLVYIRDLGSLNGTFIEETEIFKKRDIQLKHGDVISLGKPFTGGEPEADHYVYKLVACSAPQEPKNRKRKVSASALDENKKNGLSPKRRRALSSLEKSRVETDEAFGEQQRRTSQVSTEQGTMSTQGKKVLTSPLPLPANPSNGNAMVSSSDKILQCIDLTGDEILPIAGNASPDSSDVNDLVPLDFNVSSTTPNAEKILHAVMKLLQNHESKKVLKTIEMLSEEVKIREERVQNGRTEGSCCNVGNNSLVRVHEEHSDGILNSNLITSSNASINTMDIESTSFHSVNNLKSSSKQISSDSEEGLNINLREHEDINIDQNIACGSKELKTPNKPDSIQPPDRKYKGLKKESSTLHDEIDSNCSKLMRPKIVAEKPDELLSNEPKEQDNLPQLKKISSDYFKSELKNTDDLKDSNSKEIEILLISNKNESCGSKNDEKVTKNLGWQYKSNSVSLCEKVKIFSEDTCIVYPKADCKSDTSKISPQVKDSPIENMKQDITSISNDVEQEMVFSQDADGVVVIDLSEDELEYSQLFMEQDEVSKEITNEKSSVIVKDELFYDIVDDNEDIELFKAHFSQCSQEQEMITKAETSKKKVKSLSHSSDDENSIKELHKTDKRLRDKGIDELKVQDIRIRLKRLDVKPYLQTNEKMAEEHSVSDEKLSHVSKQIDINVKTCESAKHKSDELVDPKQLCNSLEVIDLHKLEIIKFNKETISNKESFDILKKDESNEVSNDNKQSKSCGSGLGQIKTFISDHTKLMESNNDQSTIDISKIIPVTESVEVNSKCLVPNSFTDSSKIKKSAKKENSSDFNVIKTVEPKESTDVCVNRTVESETLFFEGNKQLKIPPSDSISGAKLVKSTLLSKPPIERKKPGRPRKKETSVTKESLKKQKQKKIVEDRKAKLKSIALEAKSKVKDSVKNIVKQKETVTQIILDKEVPKNSTTVEANQHQDKICGKEKLSDKYEPSIEVISSDKHTVKLGSFNNKSEDNLARSNQVAKVTEKNRSSILLEGLLEAPVSRSSRIKRKLQKGNNALALIEPMSTRPRSGIKKSAGSSKGEEVSVAKTEKSKSCLKTLGAPVSNKKVTFNPKTNVKTFICEGVMIKSVNAMSSKDKAPSICQMGKAAPVVTTLEETYFDVVHWNASWVNEVKVVPGEPPVYEEKYNAKDSYVSYKDYKRWLYPLMVYELWGNMCKTMVDEDANKTIRVFDGIVLDCLHFEAHATNGKNLLILKCFFPLYGKQAQSIVDPMDILLIKAQSACNGQRICFVLFGLVYSTVMFSSHRETSDPIARHYLSTLNKQPDVCTYFDVIIYKSQKKQMSTGFQLRIRPLYNMMNELRQFESLMKLASSPLSDIIIDPVKNSKIYLQKDLNNKIISQYPLNAEQQNAILCSTQSVFANKPSISLIHGPPGTGKTQVIVAIVEQLLYRFKLKNNSKRKKILICSQSNAAVDEICLRLLDVRKQLPREKRFKLTRFGRKEKMHPRVLEIQTATLARKEVEKRNLNDDFTLELSLQKATERMIATALENSNSPNIGNYRKKYEKVQQIITSLEAVVNNTSSKETRSKEIERLVFDEEMKVIYHSDIIATTLGSCSHRKITKALNELSRPDERREVGVCIIDEATQASEADTLMPLVYDVKNFILVGDPQQLPTYVVSPTAKKCGLGQSLFSRLYKVWSDEPSAPLYLLTVQHRMHPEIAHFPSKTFYNGLLTTPSFLAIKRPFKPYAVITHQFAQDNGSSETNVQEAGMILETAERLLLEPDMKGLSIGLIVPYQKQRSLILELIHDKKLMKQLTVNTIDSYQGQEKDIILLSCVRTSGIGFLNDNQRINVALTRAKKAMYIIANFVSLESTNIWKELLADARERNLHLDLGQAGKVEDIFDFIFERSNKKSRTSSS